MAETYFEIPVRYTFEGSYRIRAKSRAEAEEQVTHHCGMVMGSGSIHTTLDDDRVDWQFPWHPDMSILK